jgi:hypothetical protein
VRSFSISDLTRGSTRKKLERATLERERKAEGCREALARTLLRL